MIASDSIYFSLKNMDIALSFLVAMFVVFYPVLSKVIPVCLVYWRRPSWSLLLSSESGLSLCRRAQFDEIRLVELGVDWGVNAGWSRHRRGQGGGFRGSWARIRLLPGRTKELRVGARRVEIVTHGTRAGSRPHGKGSGGEVVSWPERFLLPPPWWGCVHRHKADPSVHIGESLLGQDGLESLHDVGVGSCFLPGRQQQLEFTFVTILLYEGNKVGQLQPVGQTFPATTNLPTVTWSDPW